MKTETTLLPLWLFFALTVSIPRASAEPASVVLQPTFSNPTEFRDRHVKPALDATTLYPPRASMKCPGFVGSEPAVVIDLPKPINTS